jgi:histidine ammonia-lyase
LQAFLVEDKYYTLPEVYRCIKDKLPISLSKSVRKKIQSSNEILEDCIKSGDVIYGLNTGFGKLSQVKISNDDMGSLQKNLIMSHSAGVGDNSPSEIVKIMMLLKIISLSRGYSGVRIKLINKIIDFINFDCIPIVPCQGSVGASGDLAPLSHMSLPLIGLGEIMHDSKQYPSKEILKKLKISIFELSHKEGLALINGTQFSSAYGVSSMSRLNDLIKISDIAGAISTEGLMGTDKAFSPKIHELKEHVGQKLSAFNLFNLLQNSDIHKSHMDCDRVQDMYSIRCMPQVHGACRDSIYAANEMIEKEINSVSDNPLVLLDGSVISAGHFHAESVAQAMDIASIATAELANISERRIFALTKGDFGLPMCLANKPGLHSGVMMWQVTASALASENKTLAHPASIDNIPTGGDQEDHVSMAPWSGRKLSKIIDNLEKILSIEILCGCLSIDFRKGLNPADGVKYVYDEVRKHSQTIKEDRILTDDINSILNLIKSGSLLNVLKNKIELK